MSKCLIKNSEYRTKLAQSGIPELRFYSFANAFVAKHGRFPNLDEIPQADSTKHVQETFKTNKYNSTSIKNILNITQTSNIQDANIVLNDTYSDLEINLLPLNEEAIVNITRRPSEYQAEEKEPVEISENINSGVVFNQIFDKLRNLYGIELVPITEKELATWENMPEVKSVSAFVHEGKIYVNTDISDIDAPIHEMTHILLGSIRFKNPQLYQELISMAEHFPGLQKFIRNYPNRTYSDILSFDLQVVPQDFYTEEQMSSKEFEEDKKKIYKFLDAFDYRAEFHKMCVEVMRHEVCYTWFRKTKWGNQGMKGTLQIMPQKYCMLTGYWEKGLLYDFDMSYFLQPGVDIDGFDPIFKQYYKEIFINGSDYEGYRPTNPLDERIGTYALWHQTSPENGAWCFKFSPNDFNTTPFLAPLLKDTILDSEIADLQKDKDMIAAYGILAGEIRLFDNAKSGTVKNQFAIDPKTMGKFMGMVKSGLDKHIQVAAMPTENTKFYQYNDNNPDMFCK